MDVKTLSTIIGHVSSATTLNVYAHVTSDMQRQAAVKIDQGIGKAEATESAPVAKSMPTMTDFQPTRKRRRRWGTGSLSQSKSGRWTGRCAITWPDGKLKTRSVHLYPQIDFNRLLHVNEGRSIEQFIWTVQYFYPHSILKTLVLSGFFYISSWITKMDSQ